MTIDEEIRRIDITGIEVHWYFCFYLDNCIVCYDNFNLGMEGVGRILAVGLASL
jgi:hypothetical protein